MALVGCGGADQPDGESSPSPAEAQVPQVDGMIVHASEYDVDETAARVSTGLEEVGMVAATVDHAAGAESVGEELRPTTLVIGGSPKAGTPIMLEDQRVGVDLPQKYLAWEDEAGEVWLGYNSVEYVAGRVGIAGDSAALDGARSGSAGIAAAASGTDEPVTEGTEPTSSDGYLVEKISDVSVAEAIARYEAAFDAQDLMAVATVDHAAGAATSEADLRPTSVTIVGNPTLGTALLQSSQTFGLDLPVRFLAWEDAEGVVRVAHPDFRVLAERHGASGVDETLTMIEKATAMFTDVAAGKG